MSGYKIVFGTDGWRAVIAEGFTYENLRRVAGGLAEYLINKKKEPLVMIGYDNRFMGRDFASAAAAELSARGVRAIASEDSCPTPTIACAVLDNKADGAIMLTASHNPYYYSGFKFIPDYAGPATEDITKAIEKEIASIKTKETKGQTELSFADFGEKYKKRIVNFINKNLIQNASLRAGLDPLYGAGGKLLPELARDCGVKAEIIRDEADPMFGGLMPDPSENNLATLRELVLDKKLDAGLALDGDADRFGVITDRGEYLSPNQVVSLLLVHMIKNRHAKGIAARTVATTHMIDAIGESYGVEVEETPVGFKHIGRLMREKPVIIGGEESGGLSVAGHIPEKDGILADLLVLEMIAAEGKPLSEIWAGLQETHGHFYNDRMDIAVTAEQKEKLMSGLKRNPPGSVGGLKVTDVRYTDGAKLYLEDGAWLLIRASGTEPLIRAYAEARQPATLATVQKAVRDMVSL